jgi:hypothetical protein
MAKYGIRVHHGGDMVSWAGYGFDKVYVFQTWHAAKYFIDQNWLQFSDSWKKANLRVEQFPVGMLRENAAERLKRENSHG